MSWEEHLDQLRDMFMRLQQAGLTVKLRKCRFGINETEYLGKIAGNGYVKPCIDKVKAVKEFPIPQTKKEVRSFLGLAGYYRKSIKNFADIAAPLTSLTKKTVPTEAKWTDECNEAFKQLKVCLCKNPVVKAPNYSKKYILQTDACEYGLGAVLSQKDEDGIDHATLYISRKLLPRECNNAIIEKECLAIKWAIDTIKVYLLGNNFILQTDHNQLK